MNSLLIIFACVLVYMHDYVFKVHSLLSPLKIFFLRRSNHLNMIVVADVVC